MKKNIIFTFFLLIVYGCSGSKRSNPVSTIMLDDSEVTISSLDKLKADTAVLSLSSLVEGCELVQLEYTEEALFKPWKTTVTEKYIGIIQDENTRASYKLFSRSGKFLCSIGSVGQGPGQYFLISDNIIDEKNELIYLALAFDDKILVYNTSGKFINNIQMPQFMIVPKIFLFGDTLTAVYIHNGDKSMVTQINIHTGQVLNEITTQIPQRDNNILYNSRNIRDIFDITHAAYDTIYNIDILNLSVNPIFIMSDNLSKELGMSKLHYQLNKYLVLTFIWHRESGVIRGLAATDTKNKRSSWIKIKNDYFGNLNVPVSLGSENFHNGYYIYNIQPEQLMENIQQCLTESNCTEKDKLILQKTLSTLKEGENNVVFIGKLKNEINTTLF